ncbi:MAG: FKBP-type peptidyl-prolyl cis-trans isomerase [Bacteroidota bacterium]|nr:FKBP-type peptidyl-prolyl cis-trans isomerase [Bacteroidota bacterium]
MRIYKFSIFTLLTFLLFSCMKDETSKLAILEKQLLDEYIEANNITVSPTESGLYYIETTLGDGMMPSPHDIVKVHYTGYLLDSTKFDSSYDRGEAFEFELGIGQVIQGWDEGLTLMQVGGEATLIIPSHLAYGDKEVGPIPPYSTLLFEVKLINIDNSLHL